MRIEEAVGMSALAVAPGDPRTNEVDHAEDAGDP